jgi:hypothetical protein
MGHYSSLRRVVAALSFFARDPSTSSGTTFGYVGGYARVGGTVWDISAGTFFLSTPGTYTVYITTSGTVAAEETPGSDLAIPLYRVVSYGGTLICQDLRTWVNVDGAGEAGGDGIANIDGGTAASVYLTSQIIEGGGAASVYLPSQKLDGGGA